MVGITYQYRVQGLTREDNEVVELICMAADEDEALRLFNAIYGPAPEPYTDLLPNYAEAFSVDFAPR